MGHRPPLRQEDILDGPVEAAGPAQSGDVPAPGHDLGFGTPKDPPPVEGLAFRAETWPPVFENLEAPQHPGALLTAAAELPSPADAIAAGDRHRLPAPRHRGAGDDGVGALPVDLLDTLVR